MAKDIFEDVRIRGEADLILEDNLVQNGQSVTGRNYKVYSARVICIANQEPTIVVVHENTLGYTPTVTNPALANTELRVTLPNTGSTRIMGFISQPFIGSPVTGLVNVNNNDASMCRFYFYNLAGAVTPFTLAYIDFEVRVYPA